MASGGMTWQLPTEKLKDTIKILEEECDELDTYIENQNVRISELEAKVERLEERDAMLTALENGGVDNWGGYDAAMENA